MHALKAQLKSLLAQPLVAQGVLTSYITSGSRPIVDDLLAGESKCNPNPIITSC
jgi:ATP-dependent RNA helicase DDX24/MAK5